MTTEIHSNPLRLVRTMLDLRQRDLARMVGVPSQRISDWETGLRFPTENQSRHLVEILTVYLHNYEGENHAR